MTCSNCSQTITPGASVCSACGTAVPLTAAATAGASGTTTISPPPLPATKACPFCGEQIQQTAIRCRFCSSDLTAPQQQQGGISVNAPSGFGTQPSIVIQNVQSTQQPVPVFTPREIKNPGLAMLLSIIIPGGGQFYNGHAGKGILILLTCWLVIPYIYGIFDAYNCAKRINRTGS